MSAPIRFLILILGGWAGLRMAMLAPWTAEAGAAARPAPETRPLPAGRPAPASVPASAEAASGRDRPARSPVGPRPPAPGPMLAAGVPVARAPAPPREPPFPTLSAAQARLLPGGTAQARPRPLPPRRWSGSAWLLVRGAEMSTLAAAGTLGGSQAGFRLLHSLTPQLGLSARISTPLRDRRGAEAALGLDWRPLPGVPVGLLAERRQAIGREGRNAFALTFYGGVSQRLARGLRLDAYAQAGVVGARSRDLFADGAARLGVPVGDVEIGGALSGGAQPGTARLDAGPQLTMRLPAAGESLRLTAEWRFRIAGGARPGSGPALTLASDF